MESIFEKLRAEFPRNAVEWRAQNVSKNGDKALALAYIDARAVMNRLDEVVGFGNWQDSYNETAKGRIVCTLSIRLDGEWVSKSDGAGDTQVEAEKGAMSDAFKRAAVKWGIGRYLYDMETPWVACESYVRNGKKHFSKFTADPWASIKATPKSPPSKPEYSVDEIAENLGKAETVDALSSTRALYEVAIAHYKANDRKAFERIVEAGVKRKAELDEAFKKKAEAIVQETQARTKTEKMGEQVDNYMTAFAPDPLEKRLNDSIPF